MILQIRLRIWKSQATLNGFHHYLMWTITTVNLNNYCYLIVLFWGKHSSLLKPWIWNGLVSWLSCFLFWCFDKIHVLMLDEQRLNLIWSLWDSAMSFKRKGEVALKCQSALNKVLAGPLSSSWNPLPYTLPTLTEEPAYNKKRETMKGLDLQIYVWLSLFHSFSALSVIAEETECGNFSFRQHRRLVGSNSFQAYPGL